MAYIFSQAEIKFLKNNVKGHSFFDLAEMFNEHFGVSLRYEQIRAAAHKRGFTNGVDCKFKKGFIPFNKGKRGIGGWEPTQFQRGHRPHNYRPVGSERLTKDGYIEVKTADPNTWESKHVLIWEAENGKRPHGHAIIFADGNRRNTKLANLMLVSRRELAVLNHKRLLPETRNKKITEAAILTADIKLMTSEAKRRSKRKENTEGRKEKEMSYTEMFGFGKDGNAYALAEIRNSWRGGMAIWNHLYKKYNGGNFPMFGIDGFVKLNVVFDEMPEHEQIALLTTYDYALIKRDDFGAVADAFREFEAETSLKEQADVIEKAIEDENCIAIGWNQTSVNGDNWTNYGGYDEEKDECIPYNINTGDKHWFLSGFKAGNYDRPDETNE